MERSQRFLFGDDIFISYSRADGAIYASGLANELVKLKFSCKIDQWGTQSGKEIPQQFRRSLRRSALLVLIGTRGAAKSVPVTKEVEEFKKTGRMIVPIIFDEVPLTNGVVFKDGVKKEIGRVPGGGPVKEALWAREIEGLPLSPEETESLRTGAASPVIVNRIEKTFKFTRRDQRLRRTFAGLALTLLVIFAVVTVWGANTVRQAGEAEKRRAGAESQRIIAEGKTRKAEDDLRTAETELERVGMQLETARAEKEKADELREVAENRTEDARRLEAIARKNAEEQRRIASSRELASSAITQLTSDPEASVLLANEAYRTAPTSQAADALRHSLLNSRVHAVVTGHSRQAPGAAFHPLGNLAATAGKGRTVIIWKVEDGETVATLTTLAPAAEEFKELRSPCFSPDGKYLVATGSDSTAFLWKWEDEKRRDSPMELVGQVGAEEALRKECEMGCGLRTVAFSPDSKHVVTAGQRGVAWVWKTDDGTLVDKFLKHSESINDVRFSPDGKYIATAGDDSCVWLWDWSVGQSQGDTRKLAQPGPVDSLAFDPGGEYLAIATKRLGDPSGLPALSDYHVSVYGMKEGKNVVRLSGHESFIWGVSFSPNGKYILTASHDGTARVYNWKNPERLPFPVILRGHDGSVNDATFSPDGEYVVTAGSDHTARLWKPNIMPRVVERKVYSSTPPWLGVLRGHRSDVVTAAFSPDGRYILSSSPDGTARAWRAEVERVEATLPKQSTTVKSAAFSDDGQFVVTTGGSAPVRVWRAEGGEQTPIELSSPGSGEYFRAAFSPDGQFVAAGNKPGEKDPPKPNAVLIWEWKSDEKRAEPRAIPIEKALFDLAFSHDPGGRYLVTASGSWLQPAPGSQELPNVVRVWDWKAPGGPQVRATISRSERPIFSVAFSRDPESRFVALAGWGEVLVYDWQVKGGDSNPISLKGYPTPPITDFSSVTFSPDGRYIAATSFTGVMVWDWQTKDGPMHPVLLRPDSTRPGLRFSAVAFSRDSSMVATVSSGDTVDLWDARTGNNLAIVGEGSYNLNHTSVAFSRDGLRILTPYRTTARIYRCEECRPADELLTLVPGRVSPQAWRAKMVGPASFKSGMERAFRQRQGRGPAPSHNQKR